MRRFHLNANQLKIIAIIAMTIDHLAAFVPIVPLKMAMRLIGRRTAPIMCFMIAEGYYHTSNRKRYLGRLILFAVISHFAYCLFNNFSFSPLKVTRIFSAPSLSATRARSSERTVSYSSTGLLE